MRAVDAGRGESMLPSAEDAGGGESMLPSVDAGGGESMLPSAEHVLVVDDEASVRTLVQAILSREGYRVLDSGDPWEALGVAERHPIDLLLTDVSMPRMNGYELAMRIESMRPETKVLFMSA